MVQCESSHGWFSVLKGCNGVLVSPAAPLCAQAKLDEVQGRISELEDKIDKIIQSDKKKELKTRRII